MKILAFDIWGDFAHFKKFYTTASPLTFCVPPPTTIFGMIGAIIGFEKEEYLKYINGDTTKIGIQILNPIKKLRMTLNLIDTKSSIKFNYIRNRTQIKTEFLKNPAYRIYVNINDENLFAELTEKIRKKENHFTVSLGLANLIANFKFSGLYDATFTEKAEIIHTAVLSENINSIEVEYGKKYFKEKFPVNMTPEREVTGYKDIVMELTGSFIKGEFKNCYKIEDKFIGLI